jgi:hypothetical protein
VTVVSSTDHPARLSLDRRWASWVRLAAPGIVVVVFLAASSRTLWHGPSLAFGDLATYPRNPSIFISTFSSAWSNRGLGGPGSASPAYLLSAGLLAITGGNNALAQKLYFVGWIPCAFISMYWFTRRHLGGTTVVALGTALLYLATPVIIGLMIAGAAGMIWSYALVPTLFAAASSVRANDGRNWWWFAIALGAFSIFEPELLVFGVPIAVVWSISKRGALRVGRGFALALLVAGLLTLPAWMGRFSSHEIYPALVDKAIADVRYTYSAVSPVTLARLAGNRGDPMTALGYNSDDPWTLWGFLLPLAALLGLLVPGKGRASVGRLAAIASLAAVAMLTIRFVGQHDPQSLARLPAALVFRNPEKLSLLLAAALVPAAGAGVHRLWVVFHGGLQRQAALFAGVLLLGGYLLAYAHPTFEGDWGVQRVRGANINAASGPLEAASFLLATDPSLAEDWRVMWIPFSYKEVLTLQWILPEWPNDPVLENIDPEALGFTRLLVAPKTGRDLNLFHFLADRASVRYVVVATGDGNRREEARRALDSDPRMSPFASTGDYAIWENLAALPRVHAFHRVVQVTAFDQGPRIRYSGGGNLLPNTRGDPFRTWQGWFRYPAKEFDVHSSGRARSSIVHVRTLLSDEWPVLRRRIPVRGGFPYRLTANVRVRNVVAAQIKVIWYRHKDDPEERAIREDYATVLNGTNDWTSVATDVSSPAGAHYADVEFLAGKRPSGSQEPADSYISNLSLRYTYEGGNTSKTQAELVSTIGDYSLVPRSSEPILDAGTTPSGGGQFGEADLLLVNPTSGSSNVLALMLRNSAYVTELLEARVRFQPTSGVWRLVGSRDALVTAVTPGVGTFPLPVSDSGARVSLVGCSISLRGVALEHGSLMSARPKDGEYPGCRSIALGRVRGSSRTTLDLQVGRGSAIRGMVMRSNAGSDHGRESTPLSFETDQRRDPQGVVLADVYHPGWTMTGTRASHVPSLLGFNLFVGSGIDANTPLIFGPQRLRNVAILVSAAGWLLLIGLALIGPFTSAPGWRGAHRKGAHRKQDP